MVTIEQHADEDAAVIATDFHGPRPMPLRIHHHVATRPRPVQHRRGIDLARVKRVEQISVMAVLVTVVSGGWLMALLAWATSR